MSADRSEKATDQRKKKGARQRRCGAQPASSSVASPCLAASCSWASLASDSSSSGRGSFDGILSASLRTFDSPEQMLDTVGRLLVSSLAPVALVMAAALAGALASGLMQSGGLQLRMEALAFKPNRLSPLSNLKNIFSAKSAVRLAKSLLPAAAVVFLAWRLLAHMLTSMPVLSGARLPQTLTGSYSLAVNAAWITVGWSALDYAVEWRSWSQRLKMTKQEIKDESKESNGNPQTKGRMRQIQRAMRKRRVKADMTKATVVITNPTHYAVALEFSYESMAAPKVLCKGRDLHAAEIREAARWAGVPMIENPPLARSLYRSVDEGQPHPPSIFMPPSPPSSPFLFRQEACPHGTAGNELWGGRLPHTTLRPPQPHRHGTQNS